MQTKKSGGTKEAKGATLEEIADNCACWMAKAQQQVQKGDDRNRLFRVSMDNPSIHQIPISMLNYGQTTGTLVQLPAYSPDLHQVIEHRFANMKQYLVQCIYRDGWGNVTQQHLRQYVLDYCKTITPELIKGEVERLKDCYRVVAAAEGSVVQVGQRQYVGTNGKFAPKPLR